MIQNPAATSGLEQEALTLGPGSLAVELFEAKLRSPLHANAQVPRTHLLERMDAADNAMVVTVFAAPGFGKTTFLTQWTNSDERPVAWISLDERDNDPLVFLTYIAVALAQLGRIDGRVFEALRSTSPTIETRVVPRLIRAVDKMDIPLILVLDDIQAIHEQSCLDALATLIMRLPAHVQIAIAGRTEPALPLPRLRSQGSVMDIGPRDLAFGETEAKALLEGSGIHLRAAEVADLVKHTEGWPVGIYLTALAMGVGRSLTVAEPVTGKDPYVADYLRTEFLDHLSVETNAFLTRTSAFREMCGPLCDALLLETDSARKLASFSRENLLLIPQDRQDRWYRYHNLFRELLVSELERREPGMLQILQSRAAHWYEENGEPEVALGYAQDAGDADHAARLFNVVAIAAYRSGRLSTVMRWLNWFLERDLHRNYPMVALAGAWLSTLAGEAETAWQLSSFSQDDLVDEVLTDGVTPAAAWAAQLDAAWCRDGMEQMKADSERALSLTPEASSLSTLALLLAGVARLLSGENDSVDEYLSDSIEVGLRTEAPHAHIIAMAEKAILFIEKGDWKAAWRWIQEGRAIISERGLEEYPTSAILYAVSAHVLAHRDGAEAAADDLVRTQRLRPQLTYAIPWLAVQMRLQAARAYLTLADPAGARTVLREAESIFRRRPDLGIFRDQLDELIALAHDAPTTAPGMSTITSAELRLLPLLATHLSFPEIGNRLFVSRHTVKSQAISIYRKLGVSSRSDAVRQAADLGLLES